MIKSNETPPELTARFDELAAMRPTTHEVQGMAEAAFAELDMPDLVRLYWHGLERAIACRDQHLHDLSETGEVRNESLEDATGVLIISGAVARTIAARRPHSKRSLTELAGVRWSFDHEPTYRDQSLQLVKLWRLAKRRYGEQVDTVGGRATVEFDFFGRHHMAAWPDQSE